ncbi:class I SAM-dependent methyltransferase [Cellulomonas sp. Leaf334]|uniref:class I SAM-dependent methyltransferase n=1 Tax=Cellulomonas sp. Leaf334 TaxID=1736339 RepID=UPI0006F4F62A|nr:class I SAM-dependent methyltransferase [Cellulomonas sp. Leaf334]KQR16417.1 hypothetical protein ASF78_03250 [Cellulomonas sp. Leaf334]
MSDRRWNHNTHYHPLTLRLAGSASSALDVGCGEGLLTRKLRSAGFVRVTGRRRRHLYWRYSLTSQAPA